jgi:hypothetical protein
MHSGNSLTWKEMRQKGVKNRGGKILMPESREKTKDSAGGTRTLAHETAHPLDYYTRSGNTIGLIEGDRSALGASEEMRREAPDKPLSREQIDKLVEISAQQLIKKYDVPLSDAITAVAQMMWLDVYSIPFVEYLKSEGGAGDFVSKYTLYNIDIAERELGAGGDPHRARSMVKQLSEHSVVIAEMLASGIAMYMYNPAVMRRYFPEAAKLIRAIYNNNPNIPADDDGVPLLQFAFADVRDDALARRRRMKGRGVMI